MKNPSITFGRMRAANIVRCETVFHKISDWSPTDWATAMAGECGEACNEIKKLRRLDGADETLDTADRREFLTNRIADELADLVIYADLLAARLGIDLGEAVVKKFNEVSARRGYAFHLKLDTVPEGCKLVAAHTGDGWSLEVRTNNDGGDLVALIDWPASWSKSLTAEELESFGFEVA